MSWAALLQVELHEYVARMKDFAATSDDPQMAFDEIAVSELTLGASRIVQQAILEHAHHCGRIGARCPASLRVTRSACFEQESLGAALDESASHEGGL